MKRRKSSPPEDTATEESTPHRVSMALVRLALRPWIVSPGLITQNGMFISVSQPLGGSVIHSLQHLLGAYCMPGTILDAGDTLVNKTDRVPALMRKADNKQAHKEISKLITDCNEDRKKQ